MNSLYTGDVVRLKAGGPDMTISQMTDKKSCCVWFAHDGTRWTELNTQWFDNAALMLVKRI